MASFASGCTRFTAWASIWAAVWRMVQRPSSSSQVRSLMLWSPVMGRKASALLPSISAASVAFLRRGLMDSAI